MACHVLSGMSLDEVISPSNNYRMNTQQYLHFIDDKTEAKKGLSNLDRVLNGGAGIHS